MKPLRSDFFSLALVISLALSGCSTPDDGVSATPSEAWNPETHDDSFKVPPPGGSELPQVMGLREPFVEAPLDAPVGRPQRPEIMEALSVPLTPLSAVDIALAGNPETRIAWQTAKTRAAQLGESRIPYFPEVNLSTEFTRQREDGGEFATLSSTYGPTLSMNWLLYDFGAREKNVDRAKKLLIAANYQYNQVFQDVVRDTLVSYYQMASRTAALEASQTALENAEKTLLSAQTRLEGGLGTQQDTLRAEATVRSVEARIERDRSAIENARAELARHLGIRVTSSLTLASEVLGPAFTLEEETVEAAVAAALRNRPSLMATFAESEAARLDRERIALAQAPDLYLNASSAFLERVDNPFAPTEVHSVGIVLEWKLFNGFESYYRTLQVKSEDERLRRETAQKELEIVSEVWTAFFAQASAQRELSATQAAQAAREKAFEAIRIGYENGLNSILDILLAQEELDEARQQVIQSTASLRIAVAQLAHATGSMGQLQGQGNIGSRFEPVEEPPLIPVF